MGRALARGSRMHIILAFLQIWEGLTLRFHRVIALDFLGFGFSDKPVSSSEVGPSDGWDGYECRSGSGDVMLCLWLFP